MSNSGVGACRPYGPNGVHIFAAISIVYVNSLQMSSWPRTIGINATNAINVLLGQLTLNCLSL
jgi:hypothetical protein